MHDCGILLPDDTACIIQKSTLSFLFLMDNQPAFDRGILLPILLGGFSIIGIIVVLFIGRSLNSPPPVSASPSATQFQYLYLGTEPAITTPISEGSESIPTEEPLEGTPSFLTSTEPSGPT